MLRFVFNWRLLAGLLIVSAIAAAALWPRTTEVDIARASRGDLVVTVDEEGQTRVQRRFIIAAPLAGRLQRIELEPGDRVLRGRTVARLTPAAPALLDPRTQAELGAAVDSAQASLGQARAERQRAAAALERARSLVKRRQGLAEAGVISKDQIEADEAALKTAEEDQKAAEFAVARGEHELRMAQIRLEQPSSGGRTINVVAPIDGVVLKRYRESEADVPAGDPLLEIGDVTDLEIVCDLLSTDAVRVSPGARVFIEGWGGSTPLDGRLRRIEPSGFMKISALGVEEQRVNVIIDFADSGGPPPALGDGYRVEVRVVVAEVKNAVKAPVGSLFRSGDGWGVFTIQEGRARLREVELGQRNDREAEVIKGLAEGDVVVLHPPDAIRDGARVAPRKGSSG